MMYSRQRMSQSRALSNARGDTPPPEFDIPELPAYEPPSAPLTAEANRQLTMLLQSEERKILKINLQHAMESLTHNAGEVNERLCDARLRYEKSKEKQRNRNAAAGEEEGSNMEAANEELERLGEIERQTDEVTGQMEEKFRAMIDAETRLQELTETVERIRREEEEAQLATLGPRRTRGQGRRRRGDDGDGDDAADSDFEGSPEREARERSAQNPPSRRFEESLRTAAERWEGMSLTERYASNNDYIGFYRMVHDAKFPNDEAPPLPHSSTWFQHMEDPNATSAAQNASGPRNSTRSRREPSESDDDIAIQRERISTKCPLTLLPYQDPVTSTKCPHSFEREAILDMIARSGMQIPVGPGRGARRVRAVKCPVCSTPFTADDLRSDPVLLRRVRRAEELAAREAEENMEGQSQLAPRPNEVTLESDAIDADDMEVEVEVDADADADEDAPAPSARVKTEPMERAVSTDSEEHEAETEESEDNDEDMDSSDNAESEEE
ncbi:uncharacterized protein N7503_010341 [Penicillium pulvis]|uniref:uncharacterized protein n=1 Tax=Penicillium pulvis TaxID=1562058 RepID=UPI002546F77A|nr:uncharacterized protein N7503_010341 [Penicillium pulvis]KAJ5785129.1 hypothetical protein N7503_010341 [Penicillium pulvis]